RRARPCEAAGAAAIAGVDPESGGLAETLGIGAKRDGTDMVDIDGGTAHILRRERVFTGDAACIYGAIFDGRIREADRPAVSGRNPVGYAELASDEPLDLRPGDASANFELCRRGARS